MPYESADIITHLTTERWSGWLNLHWHTVLGVTILSKLIDRPEAPMELPDTPNES